MRLLAEEHRFQLRTYTKAACPFVGPSVLMGAEKLYGNCEEWNERLITELVDVVKPDLVITSTRSVARPATASENVPPAEDFFKRFTDGFTERWSEITAAGLPLVAIRDAPGPGFDVPECVTTHRGNLEECAFDRLEATVGSTAQIEASKRVGITLVDLTDSICGVNLCPAVVNDILVWRDNHHLSATYAASLAPILGQRLEPWFNFG
jgi:hypothetical protein